MHSGVAGVDFIALNLSKNRHNHQQDSKGRALRESSECAKLKSILTHTFA